MQEMSKSTNLRENEGNWGNYEKQKSRQGRESGKVKNSAKNRTRRKAGKLMKQKSEYVGK